MSSYLYIDMKNRVRELRMERGVTQAQLAESLGVSRQTVNSIETEKYTPSLPLAIILARFFGTKVEGMFFDETDGDGSGRNEETDDE